MSFERDYEVMVWRVCEWESGDDSSWYKATTTGWRIPGFRGRDPSELKTDPKTIRFAIDEAHRGMRRTVIGDCIHPLMHFRVQLGDDDLVRIFPWMTRWRIGLLDSILKAKGTNQTHACSGEKKKTDIQVCATLAPTVFVASMMQWKMQQWKAAPGAVWKPYSGPDVPNIRRHNRKGSRDHNYKIVVNVYCVENSWVIESLTRHLE